MTANAMWRMITAFSAFVQFLKLTIQEVIVVPQVSIVVHLLRIPHFLQWLNFKRTIGISLQKYKWFVFKCAARASQQIIQVV